MSTSAKEYVFPISDRPCLSVAGTDKVFPVHRIYCVGRNYADHAIEMGSDPTREEPFFFTKPYDAIVNCNTTTTNTDVTTTKIPYPLSTTDLHHEVEMVIAIGKTAEQVTVDDAMSHVYGYTIGVDLTRRDLQAKAKLKGQPWCTSKGFDNSAPIGQIVQLSDIKLDEEKLKTTTKIWLNVNNERRQTGHPFQQMIWSVSEIISILSHYFILVPGDLIFTGTPAGVSALKPNDIVIAGMDSIGQISFQII